MTIYPCASSWVTARTSSAKITTDNCQIVLNQKIEKINKVLVNGASVIIPLVTIVTPSGVHSVTNVKYSQLSTTQSWEGQLKEIDITDFVLEEEKYQTLPLTKTSSATPVKNNSWYYSHNADRIIIVNDNVQGWQLQTSVAASLIVAAAGRGKALYLFYEGDWYSIAYNSAVDVAQSLLSWQFRVYYTPLGESVKLEVPKTNPQGNQFSIPYSQQQPIVDSVTHGREMQSIANRTGCEKKEIVRTCHDLGELRHPRDGWGYVEKDAKGNPTGNIWRLTAAHFSIYCETYIIVKETWSKNWSYRSENVPINREFRSWNIPADIVQRNLHWNDYCLIKRVKEGQTFSLPGDYLISEWAQRQILSLKYYETDTTDTECSNMWFYQLNGDNEKHGAVMSCSAFGFGNSLVFSGKTKDNLSAGVQRVKSDDKDGNYQFCKDVYYCDDDGKIGNMYIQVGAVLDVAQSLPEVVTESLYMYPEFKTVKNTGGGTAQFIPYNAPREGHNLFKEDLLFRVLKDPSEQLNFTYQLHMMTDDGFLVIGSSWAANCPLVRRRNGTEVTKTWKLTHYLPQGAQVMTSAYGVESTGGINISVANNTITFPPMTDDDAVGMCITDGNDNVLLALNSRDGATFKLHYTHFYKSIAEALN